LETLHLYGTTPDWTATTFPSRLKYFVLHLSDFRYPRPSCHQIASVLQQLSALEELTFHNSLSRESIFLPRTDLSSSLRRLAITGWSTELHRFFSHYRPPRIIANVTLVCNGEDVDYDYTLLHASILDLMMPDVDPPPHPRKYIMPSYARDDSALDIDRRDCYTEVSLGVASYELRVRASLWRQSQLPAGPPPTTNLDRTSVAPTIDLVYSTKFAGSILGQLQNSPFFDTIRHMTIYGNIRSSPATVSLIQQSKSLHSLVLQPARDSGLLDLVEGGLIGTRSRMSSPELKTIVFQGVDFNEFQYRRHTEPVLSYGLNVRAQESPPLERLVFQGCRNVRLNKWVELRKKYGTELIEEPEFSLAN